MHGPPQWGSVGLLPLPVSELLELGRLVLVRLGLGGDVEDLQKCACDSLGFHVLRVFRASAL